MNLNPMYPNSAELFAPKSIPIISWSGGLDSTYALYEYLRRGETVDLLCLDMLMEGRTVLVQEKATNAILVQLRRLISEGVLPGKINRVVHHRIGTTSGRDHRAVYGLHQVAAIFEGVTFACKDYNSEIVISYVAKDLTLPFYDDFKECWRLLSKIMRLKSRGGEPFNIDVVFPFSTVTKEEALRALDPTVADLITWCNVPDAAPDCSHCLNCNRMITEALEPIFGDPEAKVEDSSYLRDRYVSMMAQRKAAEALKSPG